MRISFLLPSKNRLALLRHAVASILVQDYRDIEIVISDNASDEDYRSYVDGLSDPRIVYDRLPNAVSVTENWQNAFSHCAGDYVLMLGDDDALVEDFTSSVLPYLSCERPDLLYLAAYHYAYPEVLQFEPRGYLAVVRNSEFLIDDVDPFCLMPRYARELAASVMDFRYRFGFNAQHFLLKTAFVRQFGSIGGIYQSPYPDTFAAVTALTHARSVTVVPKESVIIGISPHSFGAYYFSNRHEEGYQFLDNERLDPDVRKSLDSVILPGDRNNTNWLIAAESARRSTVRSLAAQVNIERYRALQGVAVLRDRYLREFQNHHMIVELTDKLSPEEISAFALLESAIRSAALISREALAKVFSAVDRELGQFTPAKVVFLNIGPHSNIADALRWIATAAGQPQTSLSSSKEAHGEAEELLHAINETKGLSTGVRIALVAMASLSEMLLSERERDETARLRALDPHPPCPKSQLQKVRRFIDCLRLRRP